MVRMRGFLYSRRRFGSFPKLRYPNIDSNNAPQYRDPQKRTPNFGKSPFVRAAEVSPLLQQESQGGVVKRLSLGNWPIVL